MIGKYFPPVAGGIEEYVRSLAGMAAGGASVTVLVHSATAKSSVEHIDGYCLVRKASWMKIGSQPISPGMIVQLLGGRSDLIHLHVPNAFAVVLVLLFRRSARVVVTHHADMLGFGFSGRVAVWLYRRLLARTSAVTLLSLANRVLACDIGAAPVPIAPLPVALDPCRYAATATVTARAGQLRAAHAGATALFVFVGRLVPYKGVEVLIAALAETMGLHCLIVGDGPLRTTLQARANRLGLAKRLAFLGAVGEAEKLAALHAADALVLPSVSVAETFGIVQVEAQLCGLPVVTTDLPTGVTDVTRHGETGLVVPPNDPQALAAALSRLAHDQALRARLGAAGRARALAHYTPDAVRPALLALYARALRDRQGLMR